MAKEIERKFLLSPGAEIPAMEGVDIVQAYLNPNPDATVRVRIIGPEARLTVKSRNRGSVRHEWEYPVPVADARAMLEHCACAGLISKTRFRVPAAEPGLVWEIDGFHGPLEGLVLAEIELPDEDTAVELPSFVGREVTDDPRYYNSSLGTASELPPLV